SIISIYDCGSVYKVYTVISFSPFTFVCSVYGRLVPGYYRRDRDGAFEEEEETGFQAARGCNPRHGKANDGESRVADYQQEVQRDDGELVENIPAESPPCRL